MYYVYILYSEKFKRTYIGQSDDIERRLVQHNKGKVKSTKPYIPYRIIYFEEYETREEALSKEKYYKTFSGRKKIKLIIKAEMAELVDLLRVA